MDKPIAVGDLVMVVRSCCGRKLGAVFSVERILHSDWRQCKVCRYEGKNLTIASCPSEQIGVRTDWLKRIPPMDELEGERTEEKLREPA